ncbi:nucleotide-binding protein [Paenibacillus sp. PsM32]|uniref:TIR domain-containing protein n=1 Tax=Paenibacillus sp. PsM32 TaxID=3030536 RepID=UPI00263B2282|nr:TIR domain-containing protein [Paenibacillus sp. PsM32]MDN4617665.1 nucleotide-binding protein [Paenibacillus sp. PsM32]
MNKNEIKRLKKSLDLIELYVNSVKNSYNEVFNYRDSFHNIFYDGRKLDELFLSIFPIKELNKFIDVLSIVQTANMISGDKIESVSGRSIKVADLIDALENIKLSIVQVITTRGLNIFYSWQSDLDNSTNRSFIESALEKSIKQFNTESALPFSLDKDTSNRAGSPDISKTILEKIDDCFMFIADISIVLKSDVTLKKAPNPNVLFELGYAQGVLGEENIVLIFNNAHGKMEELPFDLRGKRIMQYNCHKGMSDDERANAKLELTKQISRAIRVRAKSEIR